VLVQLKSVAFTAVFAPVMTVSILWILRRVMGDLRVDADAEAAGLDLSQHSETAYASGTGMGTLGGHTSSSALSSATVTSHATHS